MFIRCYFRVHFKITRDCSHPYRRFSCVLWWLSIACLLRNPMKPWNPAAVVDRLGGSLHTTVLSLTAAENVMTSWHGIAPPPRYCPACRTTLVATRFRVAVICPIIKVPHCIRVFFYFVWFVFINHIFQFYYELCTYCNILDIYLS